MDRKPNFVKNGGIFEIPIGFRFHPTDEELLVHYLKPKVHSLPLPAAVIPEQLDAFRSNPWDLPGDSKEKRYFFSKRNRNANECNRISTGSGYWKGIGKKKYVVASGSNQRAIGVRKTMVFYQGKRRRRPHGSRTHWIMHEFQLMGSVTTPNTYQKLMTKMEDWVVCCIDRKKTKSKRSPGAKNRNISSKVGKIPPCVLDIIVEDKNDSGPQPSSSCSSEITEISSKGSDHEEEINQCLHY